MRLLSRNKKYWFILAVLFALIFIFFYHKDQETRATLLQTKLIANNLLTELSSFKAIKTGNDSLFIIWLQHDKPNSAANKLYYCNKYKEIFDGSQLLRDGNIQIVNPSPAFSESKELFLVWGEKRHPSETTSNSTIDLMYSYCSNGRWSNPESSHLRIRPEDNIRCLNAWHLYTDKFNNPTILINSFLDTSKTKNLFIIKRTVSGWGKTTKIAENCAYYSAFIDNRNYHHIAFIKGARTGRKDMNSVFYTCSKDGGISFTKPILVQLSGSEPAHKIKILVDDKNIVHLIYKKQVNNRKKTCIIHAYSNDGIIWSKEIIVSRDSSIKISEINFNITGNKIVTYWEERTESMSSQLNLFLSYYKNSYWEEPALIFHNILFPNYILDNEVLNIIGLDISTYRKNNQYPLSYYRFKINYNFI